MANFITNKFEALGTVWTIELKDSTTIDLEKVQIEIRNLITQFENKYSRFKEDSLLYSLKDKVGIFEVGEEFIEILELYFKYYDLTGGKFSPLVGSLLEDLGYDKNYSFESKSIRPIPGLETAIKIIDHDSIEILKPISFDFGGLGKGFLIDKVYDFLIKSKIESFTINAGGDIRCKLENGDEKLEIGLENPVDLTQVVGIYRLNTGFAICGSSSNRRRWSNNHHILDIDHKKSTESAFSTWVVSRNATEADVLATCLFFCEPEILLKVYDFEYLIIDENMSARFSDGFKDCLF
jgi:thiamine biosynthesis lipoprotein